MLDPPARHARVRLLADRRHCRRGVRCSGSTHPCGTRQHAASHVRPRRRAVPGDGARSNGSVTHQRASRRAIVSLSPTATEMLFAIGAGARCGRWTRTRTTRRPCRDTTLDSLPAQRRGDRALPPRPGGRLRRDRRAGRRSWRRLRITVLDEPAAANLAQVYQQLVQLGKVTGHAGGAHAEVADMKQQIAAHREGHAQSGTATYYYELDQTYYSVTSSTFIGQVLRLLGLHSIADSASGAASQRRVPATVRGVHPQGQPGLRPPGRHDLLQAVCRDGGGPSGLVGARRGTPGSRRRTERRHRLSMGPTDRGPAERRVAGDPASPGRRPVMSAAR